MLAQPEAGDRPDLALSIGRGHSRPEFSGVCAQLGPAVPKDKQSRLTLPPLEVNRNGGSSPHDLEREGVSLGSQ